MDTREKDNHTAEKHYEKLMEVYSSLIESRVENPK